MLGLQEAVVFIVRSDSLGETHLLCAYYHNKRRTTTKAAALVICSKKDPCSAMRALGEKGEIGNGPGVRGRGGETVVGRGEKARRERADGPLILLHQHMLPYAYL